MPQKRQWIYVGDSGSDIYPFWQTCEDLGYDFVIRVAQDRVVEILQEDAPEDLNENHLKTMVRALPATSAHFLSIPAHHHPKREAFLQMSFQKVQVQPPTDGVCLRKTALTAWVIRVWETHPPQGQEALEWILLTTLPITFPCDAWEVVQWYGWRWWNGGFPQGTQDRLRLRRTLFANRRSLLEAVGSADPRACELLLRRPPGKE